MNSRQQGQATTKSVSRVVGGADMLPVVVLGAVVRSCCCHIRPGHLQVQVWYGHTLLQNSKGTRKYRIAWHAGLHAFSTITFGLVAPLLSTALQVAKNFVLPSFAIMLFCQKPSHVMPFLLEKYTLADPKKTLDVFLEDYHCSLWTALLWLLIVRFFVV